MMYNSITYCELMIIRGSDLGELMYVQLVVECEKWREKPIILN